MAARAIVPLPELADHPIAVRDEAPVDGTSARQKLPIWVEPSHGFGAPMCQAVATTGAYINDWADAFPNSFPPIIINITDGQVTDSPYKGADLRTWAKRLVGIETADGQALLFNLFLSPLWAPGVYFPASDTGLPPPGPTLFSISSPLPQSIINNARRTQTHLAAGARGLVFNADLSKAVAFLEIGTRHNDRGH
ncbi:hypothetical protein [Geodermatophilus sp. SYSU D01176]